VPDQQVLVLEEESVQIARLERNLLGSDEQHRMPLHHVVELQLTIVVAMQAQAGQAVAPELPVEPAQNLELRFHAGARSV
jgi:hypothetical protein